MDIKGPCVVEKEEIYIKWNLQVPYLWLSFSVYYTHQILRGTSRLSGTEWLEFYNNNKSHLCPGYIQSMASHIHMVELSLHPLNIMKGIHSLTVQISVLNEKSRFQKSRIEHIYIRKKKRRKRFWKDWPLGDGIGFISFTFSLSVTSPFSMLGLDFKLKE